MRIMARTTLIFLAVVVGPLAARSEEPRRAPKTRNVILVTTDGVRWQEIFRGADLALFNKRNGGVTDPDSLGRKFGGSTAEDRRKRLMPFLWSVVARNGQLYGNADRGSPGRVTNGKNFSYPGYNELLTGAPDPRIDSNDKRLNPNVTVLEWLNRKPAYHGKVAAICCWDVFPFILNRPRSGLFINACWEPFEGSALTEGQKEFNRRLRELPRAWSDGRSDALTNQAAVDYLNRETPRVLYIAFGDTDEYAHAGRYDRYLETANQVDGYLRALWDAIQASPVYRDSTALVITTDHGRGDPPRGWRDHGATTSGSDGYWIGLLGPDVPPLGERTETGLVTQSQVAATVAAMLGEDFTADFPRAARPIGDAIRFADDR
jgi:hypothetical protein